MFTYRCPACGKQHVVDGSLAHEYAASCLRCRQVIHVTAELVHGSTAATSAGQGWRSKASAVLSHSIQSADALARPASTGSADGELSARENVDDPGAVEKGQEHDWADRPADPSNPQDSGKQKKSKQPADDGNSSDKKKRKSKPGPEAPLAKGRRRWLVITGIAAAVLALIATGGYFGYDYYRKTQSKVQQTAQAKETGKSKTVAKSTKTSTAATKSASAAGTKTTAKTTPADKGKTSPSAAKAAKEKMPPDKLEKVAPAVKPRDDKVIRLAAARLSTELDLDPEGTNQKYKSALLEITGTFEKTVTQEGANKVKSPYVVFASGGPPISCDMLGGHTDIKRLADMQRAQSYTIRGTYERDGILRTCELMPLSVPADQEFRDKELEVVGYAARVFAGDRVTPFPRIILENETNGLTVLECLFRKSDEEKVLAVTEDAPIIVRGVCGGRYQELGVDTRRIRLNNCELVLTSAPADQTRRMNAFQVTRAYEEDLRTTLIPLQDERLERVIPVARLEAEFKTDGKAFERKYRFKTFAVAGTRLQTGGSVVLATGNTDAVLKVRCQFTKRALKELDPGSTAVIEGFCSGMADPQTLVLENCEALDENGQHILQRLTADYFPRTPGLVRIYDIAQHPVANEKPRTSRVQIDYKEDGLLQTVYTHVNQYVAARIFDPAESKWTSFKNTKKLRLPGPAFRIRAFGGFIQMGHYKAAGDAGSELYYEPILKLSAKPGDTWRWTHDHFTYEYKLVKFDAYRGEPSAIIEETITRAGDPHHPRELRIVYARGLGEVERREYLRVGVNERRLLLERRLVDDQEAIPAKSEATRSAAGNRGS